MTGQLELSMDSGESLESLRQENDDLRRKIIERTEALLKAQKDLSVIDRMKREFITLVSHELRTPVTSMMGMAVLIQSGLYESKTELESMAKAIHDEANRLVSFVDDMIEFIQWVAGRMVIQPVRLDARSIAAEAIEHVTHRYAAKHVTITMEGMPEVFVTADIFHLQGCMTRILDNAVKFSKPNGRVTVTFEGISAFEREGYVTITIRDEGCGIPRERLECIFRAMSICHSYENHTGGSGLGLVLCREILRAHGGSIRVESEGKEKGCEVTITLPVRTGGRPAPGAAEPPMF
jgi:signal transduction histidine kinase